MALYELTSGKDFVKLGDKVFSKYEEVPRDAFQFNYWLHQSFPQPHEFEPDVPDDIAPRLINRKLCHLFGSKITLRLNAALYSTFIKSNFPVETYFAINRQGKQWRTFSPVDVNHAIANKHLIDQAVKDHTINLIPLMLTYEEDTQQLRKRFGKGLWKQLSHTSKARMRYLAPLLHKDTEFVTVRTGILKKISIWEEFVYRNNPESDPAKIAAAKIAPRVADFEHTEMVIRDTLRMAQRQRSEVNYDWSYRRWHEEHELLSREINKSRFPDKKFTGDCIFTEGGYTFTLLTSELDIATEGNTMKHCVSSYAQKASNRNYNVFKIEGKERATLGIDTYADSSLGVDQCYGYCNQTVSSELRSMLPLVVRMYDDHIRLRDERIESGSY